MISKYIVKSTIIHLIFLIAISVLDLAGIRPIKQKPTRNVITFDFVKIGAVSIAHNNIVGPNVQQNKNQNAGAKAPAKKQAQQTKNIKKPEPKQAASTQSKAKPIPTQKPKPVPQKKQATPKKQQTTKNTQNTKKNDTTLGKKKNSRTSDNMATNAEKVGGILTASQTDVIKQRLYNTWHIPIGIKNIKNIVIDVRIELNSDGYVTNIRILKTSNCDPSDLDIMEKSIYRALYSTEFSPLPFDKKSYNNWKTLDLCFYPGDMI